MKIIAQTPTRIGLIGGGTDVNPFAAKYGGKVLSLSINLRHKAILMPLKGKNIYIEAMGEKRNFSLNKNLIYGKDEKFDLIYSIINYFKPKIKTGFHFIDEFSGFKTAGLGSSGSAAVSMIGAFNYWLDTKMGRKEIALAAWKMEAEELDWVTGKQDQLAATFGGINIFTFGKGEEKFGVLPIKLKKTVLDDLKKWSLMIFTGGHRHSASLQKKLKEGMSDKEKIAALKRLCQAVDKTCNVLKKGNFITLGKILNKAWEDKKRSNPEVSNPTIDKIYNLAKKTGALGGKIMGAGGEGHMFFLCLPEKKPNLIRVFKKRKLKIINFDFDFKGLEVKVIK